MCYINKCRYVYKDFLSILGFSSHSPKHTLSPSPASRISFMGSAFGVLSGSVVTCIFSDVVFKKLYSFVFYIYRSMIHFELIFVKDVGSSGLIFFFLDVEI